MVGEDGLFIAVDINDSIQHRSKKIGYWINKALKRKNEKSKEELVTADAAKLPFDDGVFDAFLAGNFTGGEEYIQEAYRVLKPGGRFISSYAELAAVPLMSKLTANMCKKEGFIDVHTKIGSPAGVVPVVWEWYVEGIKPPNSHIQQTDSNAV